MSELRHILSVQEAEAEQQKLIERLQRVGAKCAAARSALVSSGAAGDDGLGGGRIALDEAVMEVLKQKWDGKKKHIVKELEAVARTQVGPDTCRFYIRTYHAVATFVSAPPSAWRRKLSQAQIETKKFSFPFHLRVGCLTQPNLRVSECCIRRVSADDSTDAWPTGRL
jgi:hypothetical protein